MKYRIKKYYNDYGVLIYVPQYRFLFMWFTFSDYYQCDIEFKNENGAIKFIEKIKEEKRIQHESCIKNRELRKNKSMYDARNIS